MKLERGHWLIIGVTVVAVAYILCYTPITNYLSQRSAEAAQAAAVAQEGDTVATEGSISTGTVLKREGVAVAELWGIKKIAATGAQLVDLTSHNSADRFREFAQGLRERDTFELIGHELPSQTTTWLSDFEDPTHRLYTVETPDGATYDFCGWVRRVAVKGELEDAIVFEGAITCTEGPLTRDVTIVDYYHCTEAPDVPGTPPDEDPDHWEETDPPGDIEDGETVFGWDGIGTDDDTRVHETIGTVFPYPNGDPTHGVVSFTGDYPTWSDAVSFHNLGDVLHSVHCIVENDVPVAVQAYGTPANNLGLHAAVYTEDGTLVAETEIISPPSGSAAWFRLDVLPGAGTLANSTSYALVLRGEIDEGGEGFHVAQGLLADYTPPDGGEWDSYEEYEYCQAVSVTTTTEETYCP